MSLFSHWKYSSLIILSFLSCKIFECAHFKQHSILYTTGTVLKAQSYHVVRLLQYCNIMFSVSLIQNATATSSSLKTQFNSPWKNQKPSTLFRTQKQPNITNPIFPWYFLYKINAYSKKNSVSSTRYFVSRLKQSQSKRCFPFLVSGNTRHRNKGIRIQTGVFM